jgi:hypothetical protein
MPEFWSVLEGGVMKLQCLFPPSFADFHAIPPPFFSRRWDL